MRISDWSSDVCSSDLQPKVEISTNSLAATDAWPVYALSHKYKRTYLRKLGFHIWEYKPFPADSMIDPDATGALSPTPAPPGPNLIDVPRRLGSGRSAGKTSELQSLMRNSYAVFC